MSENGGFARSRPCSRVAVVLGTIILSCLGVVAQHPASAEHSAGPSAKSGTIIETRSDKRVVQTGRWYVVRQFTVDFTVQCTHQTYCGEVTTTVINEVDDLMASKGKPVELQESGKDIDVTLQNGRRIKAHQVDRNKCAQN
jgi:hypothetical protein